MATAEAVPRERLHQKLYLERSALFWRAKPYRFWLLVGALLVVGDLGVYVKTAEPVFVRTALPLAIGATLVPFGVRLGFAQLSLWLRHARLFVDEQSSVLDEVIEREMDRAFALRSFDLAGLVVVLVALPTFVAGGFFVGLDASESFALASSIALAACAGGVGIYSLWILRGFVARIGHYPVRLEPHIYDVLVTGQMLVRCYLVAAGIWFVISLSASWRFVEGWAPLAILALPALVILIGSFVAGQVPLHRRMKEYKRIRIEALGRQLRDIMPTSLDDLSADTQRKVEFLEGRLDRVARLPEWPFSTKGIASVSISAVISIIPVVAQAVAQVLAGR